MMVLGCYVSLYYFCSVRLDSGLLYCYDYKLHSDLVFFPKKRWFDGVSHTGANRLFCFYLVWGMGSSSFSTLYRATDWNSNGHIYRPMCYCAFA